MNNSSLVLSLLLISAPVSCSSFLKKQSDTPSQQTESPSHETEGGSVIGNGLIDLQGAKFVGLAGSKLLLIDSEKHVRESTGTLKVLDVFETSLGLLIESETTYYHASADGTSIDLGISTSDDFMGENKNHQLFFRSGEYFDLNDKSKKKIVSSLRNLYLMQLSGNFIIVRSVEDDVYQVLDTVKQTRFNIGGCNGPRIAALSTDFVYVDDCQKNSMMDMQSGVRTLHEFSVLNGETIATHEGALAISQLYTSGVGYEYKLQLIKPDGTKRVVSDQVLVPATGSSNEVNNKTLFLSEDNIVVRQLNEVSHFLFSTGEKRTILEGYNVHWVDVHDQIVWFFGDDKLGHGLTGQYDLIPGQAGVSPLDTRGAVIEKIVKVPQQ